MYAKFVVIGLQKFSSKFMDTTLQRQPLLPINITFEAPSVAELEMPRICMTFNQMSDAIGANGDVWSWSERNEQKCTNDDWFSEIHARQVSCKRKPDTDETTPAGGAK